MTGARVLVTGAAGMLGRKLIPALTGHEVPERVVATDLRVPDTPGGRGPLVWEEADVRDAGRLRELMGRHRVDTVVHLAAVVTPPRGMSEEELYWVDVEGSRNVVDACLEAGVAKLIVTSSGAAYGYHPDQPPWLEEDAPLLGHDAFAYAKHKRMVEELLAEARASHPDLAQLVFRPGTILGVGVRSPVTALFEKPVLPGVAGSSAPFVFIWDEDVVACLVRGVFEPVTGIFNLAGDGAVSLPELARRMGKPFVPIPAGLLRRGLGALRTLGLTGYGPEQVDFLRYRPVLSNRRLKEVFGYTPSRSSAQAFDAWWSSR